MAGQGANLDSANHAGACQQVKIAAAMAAGVSKTVWTMDNIVALIDAASSGKRGAYKSVLHDVGIGACTRQPKCGVGAAEKRADAARARRWAKSISAPIDKDRLQQIAIELEGEADDLERQAKNSI